MKRVKTTPAGLAAALRKLSTEAPQAVEDEMVNAGMMLQGPLVQKAIAETSPHQPVDQGQYKAAWAFEPIEGGALVGNASKQALWIERGRAPGPVPFGPILAWVKRKAFVRTKGADAKEVERAEVTAALAIQRKIEQQGVEPRWVCSPRGRG